MRPDDSGASGPLRKKVVILDKLKGTFILSPVRLVATLALCTFIIETLVMIVLESTEPVGWKETIMDASILTFSLFAILYYTLFKPLVILINDYKLKQVELKAHQEQLELKVQERTAELKKAYLDLKAENEETLKTRAALSESEDRFRQLFDQSEDGIVLFSLHDHVILDVNPTAEHIFRKERAEILATGFSSLCDPEECALLLSVFARITQDNAIGIVEKIKCTLVPGEVHIVSFHGKKIPLQGSEVIFATFRDITARVRLMEQAQEIQARLIQANRMTSLGTMVSSVVHEINNPNNFLLMNAGIIKRFWDDIAPVVEDLFQSRGDFAVANSTWSETRTFLPDAIEGIQQGAIRISEIVGTLKNYGRENHFNQNSQADVNAVVQLSAAILSHHISSSTHRFTLDLSEGLPLVRGSARQLEQVVINLIQNALQALPDPEHGVHVATFRDQETGQVLIQVSDEGCGIAPEVADRIMEPFFSTRQEQGGTGLGLAISATIVKEHGGVITFSSLSGKGSVFTIRLNQVVSSEHGGQDCEADHVYH
ncbi:MAG TPA: PAS domain S-box protein [Desulfuromonadales bacterium]|nr:PAS domain S-box protein [Desulfuromonadales bacterium]